MPSLRRGNRNLMIVFMAGGVSGNCFPFWRELISAEKADKIDIYLAGTQGRRWVVDDLIAAESLWGMDIWHGKENGIYDQKLRDSDSVIQLAILESFYYADEWTEWVIPRISDFMLDSGAFTFMENSKKSVDWEEYLQSYIDFINRNDVRLFFELDIDSIVGYEEVLKLRHKLEEGTGKKCIPVWHVSRGYDEFLHMCDEYDYVAIGGIVSGEITRRQYAAFPAMIREAHKRGAKIHGLGFTNLKLLKTCHFDSVDSTAWTTGNRFGSVYQFNGETMVKHNKPDNTRLHKPREAAINNFNEWVKFQDYARTHL